MRLSCQSQELGSGSTPKATYIPSSSGSATLPDGIVHIYRDAPKNSRQQFTFGSTSKNEPVNDEPVEECKTVAVLAVPPWMTPADFLAFVAPAAENMAHLRLIRDAAPNCTMVVVQFREASAVSEFIAEFNGQPFNSLEVGSVFHQPLIIDLIPDTSRKPVMLLD